MEGEIAAREQDRGLVLHFRDRLTDVTVDFALVPAGAQTSLTHEIAVRTLGFGKLFTPMIRRTLPRQTTDAMTRLKALAESSA